MELVTFGKTTVSPKSIPSMGRGFHLFWIRQQSRLNTFGELAIDDYLPTFSRLWVEGAVLGGILV